MEKIKTLMTQSQNLSTVNSNSLTGQIVTASKGKTFEEADNKEIKQCIAYGIYICGIPTNKIPNETQELILIDFLRSQHSKVKVSELKQAFVYGASKRLDIDLKLWGESFSAKYIGEIIAAYNKLKTPILRKLEDVEPKENNLKLVGKYLQTEQGQDLKNHLTEKVEAAEEEKKTRKEKLKQQLSIISLPNEEICQDYLREFDKLYNSQDINSSPRMVKYDGLYFGQTEYVNYRLKENK